MCFELFQYEILIIVFVVCQIGEGVYIDNICVLIDDICCFFYMFCFIGIYNGVIFKFELLVLIGVVYYYLYVDVEAGFLCVQVGVQVGVEK